MYGALPDDDRGWLCGGQRLSDPVLMNGAADVASLRAVAAVFWEADQEH